MNKKILILIFLVSILFINISGVLAETCGDCAPGNCAACGCVANSSGTACVYDNYKVNNYKSCGNNLITNIPALIPDTVNILYNLIQIAVPVVLVVMGMLDLFKGIMQQKEDEIKKGQQLFIKRILSATLVFSVFVIVKLVISVVADSTESRILECAECFIEKNCD